VAWNSPGSTKVLLTIFLLLTFGASPRFSHAGTDDARPPRSTDHVEDRPEQQSRAETRDAEGPVDQARKAGVSLGREVLKDAQYILTSPLRLDAKSGLILGGVAAGIGGLFLLDDEIQTLFQQNRDHSRDDIADVLNTLGDFGTVTIGNVALISTGWLFRNHVTGNKLMQTALVSLEAQLFADGIAGMTKFAVGRNRPTAGEGSDSFQPFHEFDRSFPSSHAARTFAVAAVFADRYEQPIPLIAYTTATLISLSRIYQNEHFSSDVLAGAVLGFTLGKVLSWRHRDEHRRWAIFPFAPDGRGSLGLTFTYVF
jgi:membrane-associated phospholipid phosphatase